MPVLTLPKPEPLSAQVDMRTRLEGTQARGEGESHAQDANVAEVSESKPVSGEPAYPDNQYRPLVPRDAMPRRRSSFRLLAMASPCRMICGSY
jgi:hypothetical protein